MQHRLLRRHPDKLDCRLIPQLPHMRVYPPLVLAPLTTLVDHVGNDGFWIALSRVVFVKPSQTRHWLAFQLLYKATHVVHDYNSGRGRRSGSLVVGDVAEGFQELREARHHLLFKFPRLVVIGEIEQKHGACRFLIDQTVEVSGFTIATRKFPGIQNTDRYRVGLEAKGFAVVRVCPVGEETTMVFSRGYKVFQRRSVECFDNSVLSHHQHQSHHISKNQTIMTLTYHQTREACIPPNHPSFRVALGIATSPIVSSTPELSPKEVLLLLLYHPTDR